MTELKETITSTKHIFAGHVVKLDVHQIKLPNGTTSQRELIDHPGAVAIVALDSNENLLLLRQFRLGANKVMIEVPAGTLEPGEDPKIAAVRELREETGYRPGFIERIGGWYVAPGYSTEYIHLFIARDLTHAPLEGDVDEFLENFRANFDEVLAMIDQHEIENTTAICALVKAHRYLLQQR